MAARTLMHLHLFSCGASAGRPAIPVAIADCEGTQHDQQRPATSDAMYAAHLDRVPTWARSFKRALPAQGLHADESMTNYMATVEGSISAKPSMRASKADEVGSRFDGCRVRGLTL